MSLDKRTKAIHPHDRPEAAALGLEAARLLNHNMGEKAGIVVVWDHGHGYYRVAIVPKPRPSE